MLLPADERPAGSSQAVLGSDEPSTSQPQANTSFSARRALVNEDIELSRRAIPVQTVEPEVCSICLDSFSEDDPGKCTACGHPYHLQCIMQWAQRSRECPLCFKPLVMQEEALNELLPFGEFVPQEGRLPAGISPQVWMGLDAWELERLLSRLATANEAGSVPDRRRIRLRSRFRNVSLQPSAEGGTLQGEGPSGHGGAEAGGSSMLGLGMPAEGPSSSQQNGQTSEQGSPVTAPWSLHSPTHSAAVSPRTPDGHGCAPSQLSRSAGSNDFRASADSFKSRLGAVSLRCRETFSKTTRDLKNRLTKPAASHSSDSHTPDAHPNGTH